MIIQAEYMHSKDAPATLLPWTSPNGYASFHAGFEVLSVLVDEFMRIRFDYLCNENRPIVMYKVVLKKPGDTINAYDIYIGKLEGFLTTNSNNYVYLREE